MELAEDALAGARRLAGMEERVFGALERRLEVQRRVERLDDALGAGEASFGKRRDMQALVGQLAGDGGWAAPPRRQRSARRRVAVAL
jgi:hypothetical protein